MTTTVLAYIPSPAQGVWHVAGVPLRAYALFIIVGIIAALVLGDRRWVARGGEPGVVYDVALWAVPFGLIGGRLYHVITDWRTYFGDDGAGLAAAFRIWDGGLGIWGAVALGGIGAWIACRRRGIPLPAFGDAVAPGIILAQAIGRLGNYFNQELYGRVTTLPWGLEIYVRENAAGVPDMLNGVSTGELIKVVHPTFLYELLWNLLVFAALILIDRRFRIGHGRLFAIYVAGYCVGRFWIELMRSDTATLLAGIRVNSFTATFVFIGAVVYVMAAPKGREDPATLQGNQDAEVDEESDLDEFVKDLAVAASTTGVVAAAKVAGEDDEKSVVEVAEAEALSADVEAEPEESGEPLTEAGGLGSVEGDEVVEATEGASAAHDAAVEGVSQAEVLAADVDAEADVEPQADLEPEVPAESVADVDDAESDGADVADADTVADTSGLGSVEGDEVVEATEGASVVHDAAVEGEAEAEVLADDAQEAAADAEADAGESVVEADEDSPEAAEDAPEAHEVAVEGEVEAEALAAEVEAEESDEAESDEPAAEGSESEPTEEQVTEAGDLGSVEGDEVAEAAEDAPEAHEVAVEGAVEAEALAAEVEAESDAEPADEAETSIAEAAEAEVEPTEVSVTEAPESDASGDEDGAESVEDERDAQLVAAEGASVVEALGAEDAESEGDDGTEVVEADEDIGADEPVSDEPEDEPAGQLIAAEGASVAEALDAEVETEEAESEGDTEPDVEPDSVDDADANTASVAPASAESSYRGGVSDTGGRVRQWLRRRRNR